MTPAMHRTWIRAQVLHRLHWLARAPKDSDTAKLFREHIRLLRRDHTAWIRAEHKEKENVRWLTEN